MTDELNNFRRQRANKRQREVLTVGAVHTCVLSMLEHDSNEYITYIFAASREMLRLEKIMEQRSVSTFWKSVKYTLPRTIQASVAEKMPDLVVTEQDSTPGMQLCEYCGEYTSLSHCMQVGLFESNCDTCGASFSVLVPAAYPGAVSFGEEHYSDSGVYKRSSHLDEYLQQIQGAASNAVSREDIDAVLKQLSIMRLQPHEVRISHIKAALKRLGKAKLYEQAAYILRCASGTDKNSLVLSDEIIAKIHQLFNMIQEPFEKYKGTRKNLLSYSFVLRKISELLGLDLSSRLPTLKSSEKRREAEKIWEHICKDLGWEYRASVI